MPHLAADKIFKENQVVEIQGRPALITRLGDDGELIDKRRDKDTLYYAFIEADGSLGHGGYLPSYRTEGVKHIDYANVRTVVDLPPDWQQVATDYDKAQAAKPKTSFEEMENHEPERHPSYGVVEISRYSGHSSLFCSPFKHQHYMGLRIKRAVKTRRLSNDNASTAGEVDLIHIAMSEAQWAKMISSAGIGGGTPCTIERLGAQQMPSCPEQEDIEKFHDDIKAAAEKASESLTLAVKQAAALLASPTATKAQRKEVLDAITKAQRQMTDTIPFVATQLQERMEHIVSEGKIEIEAFAQRTLLQTGLAAIANQAPKLTFSSAVQALETGKKEKP